MLSRCDVQDLSPTTSGVPSPMASPAGSGRLGGPAMRPSALGGRSTGSLPPPGASQNTLPIALSQSTFHVYCPKTQLVHNVPEHTTKCTVSKAHHSYCLKSQFMQRLVLKHIFTHNVSTHASHALFRNMFHTNCPTAHISALHSRLYGCVH